MFFDFSSAFNTIQLHILANKLLEMNVCHDFTRWILNYLTNRSQYVNSRSSNSISDAIISNTGAQQGTVLAPFLFTLYTSNVRSMKFKPALPSIIIGNTQSLRNKFDELKSCSILRREYRDTCLMCFSETWFKPGIDTQQFSHIDGFTCIRGYRTLDSGKSCG